MYRFSDGYYNWERSPEKRGRYAFHAMPDENAPDLKIVLLDIGIYFGIISIIVALIYAVFG